MHVCLPKCKYGLSIKYLFTRKSVLEIDNKYQITVSAIKCDIGTALIVAIKKTARVIAITSIIYLHSH